MRLCLPHPSSLDVLPSPTSKWSATTHPLKEEIFGYINSTISYHHFYFHHGSCSSVVAGYYLVFNGDIIVAALPVGPIMIASTSHNLGLWVVLLLPTVGIRRYHTKDLAMMQFHHATNHPPQRNWGPRLQCSLILPP